MWVCMRVWVCMMWVRMPSMMRVMHIRMVRRTPSTTSVPRSTPRCTAVLAVLLLHSRYDVFGVCELAHERDVLFDETDDELAACLIDVIEDLLDDVVTVLITHHALKRGAE